MLDPTLFDTAAEELARSLPEQAMLGVPRLQPPPELLQLLDPPTWGGVSRVWRLSKQARWPLRRDCAQELRRLREKLGPTRGCLEAFLPDFGFSAGAVSVDYGGRGALSLRLDADNKVAASLRGRRVQSLPGPLKCDHATTINQTREWVRLLRREVARTDRLLRMRFKYAARVPSDQIWTPAQWRIAMSNPLFMNAASGWLFAAFGNPMNRFRFLFAVDESGGAVDIDDSERDVEGLTIRAAQPRLLSHQARREWEEWFANRQVPADLPVPEVREESGSTGIGFGSWQHMWEEQRVRAQAGLLALGWTACPWGATREDRKPWMEKKLGECGPWATLFASGDLEHMNSTELYFSSGRRARGAIRPCDVDRFLMAEVFYDLELVGESW